MPKETLTLDVHGKNFLLKQTDGTGAVSEIILTPQSVLTLAQSAPRLSRAILAKQSAGGIDAGVHMPVARISLSTDMHLSAILLGMIDANGAEERFSLPLEVAKPLAERLPYRVAEIEASIPNRTQQ